MRIALFAVVAGAMLASPPVAFGKGMHLIANVGLNDASVISLTTETGAPVTDIPAGVYLIEVRDDSSLHNFHLLGAGVDRSTEVGFVGTVRWAVFFQWKERYRYLSDPDAAQMRRTFTTDGGPPLIATVGPGVNRRTSAGFRGQTTWILTLRPGRYRFGCDTQAARMRASFSVSAPV